MRGREGEGRERGREREGKGREGGREREREREGGREKKRKCHSYTVSNERN